MKIIHGHQNFPENIATAVTIGTFDGFHIGHQKIIDHLVKIAREKNLKSVLLTFFPHPRMVIQETDSLKLIHTIEERIQILSKTELDYLVIQPFDKNFANLSAFEFVRNVLVDNLNTFELTIGYDHRFGKNREGNFEQLKEYSHLFEFQITEIKAQDINQITVSSTKIRKALNDGNILTANKFLNHPFSISGKVVSGAQLGNTIGFPTANIYIAATYKLIPKTGAYLVKTFIQEKSYWGMLNIGNRPTVNGKNTSIEVNIFDFEENLYDQEITVAFYDFLRDETKFESVDSLKYQLNEDKKNCLEKISKLS